MSTDPLKDGLSGKSSKALLPDERALELHLAPMIFVGGGALMVLASMFMPTASSIHFDFIVDNMVIQNDPELLLCSVAATAAAVRYWRVGSTSSANIAIVAGFCFFIWTVIASQGLTIAGSNGYARAADAVGPGLWTAGVGSLLVAYGGLMMRFPHLGFGLAAGAAKSFSSIAPTDGQSMFSPTKTCPRCAEKIKAAATVCRYCHYEFETESAERQSDRTKTLS